MSLRSNGSAFRAIIAAFLFLGVLTSVGLSAAPQLHASVHNTNAPDHQCAATHMSSGSWHQSTSSPLLTAPQPVPTSDLFVRPPVRLMAHAAVSILEHAPPANS
ncbi:MAG: hypothetical protein M3Y69_07450 [Verrucomicrobiota bacterium]|nr:hypothetical protein [Verrucomicrobiota bacterium]